MPQDVRGIPKRMGRVGSWEYCLTQGEANMAKIHLIIASFFMIALAANTDPKIEAVPLVGKQKMDLAKLQQSKETGLIKTEKTFFDKNCQKIQGKTSCRRKNKRIERKVVD